MVKTKHKKRLPENAGAVWLANHDRKAAERKRKRSRAARQAQIARAQAKSIAEAKAAIKRFKEQYRQLCRAERDMSDNLDRILGDES